MSKVANELMARAEVAMMGFVVPVRSDAEVQSMYEYICGVLDHEEMSSIDVMARIRQYTKTHKVSHLFTKRIYGMPCVGFVIENDDPEQGVAKPFTQKFAGNYYNFTYVLNLADDDMCSEFGDSFFSKHGDIYKCVS